MKTVREMFASRAVKITAIVVGILLISFVSFASGALIGLRKAKFSSSFGENYQRNFVEGNRMMNRGDAPSRGDMMGRNFEDGKDFRNGHGVAGEILSLSDTSIVIKDRDSKENTVAILPTTIVMNGRNTIKLGDLATGTNVVVIGKPNATGSINADFIRVFNKDMTPNGTPGAMMNRGVSPSATGSETNTNQ